MTRLTIGRGTNPLRALLTMPFGAASAATIATAVHLMVPQGRIDPASLATLCEDWFEIMWTTWAIGLLIVGGPFWVVGALTRVVGFRTAAATGFICPFVFMVLISASGPTYLPGPVSVRIGSVAGDATLAGIEGTAAALTMWVLAYVKRDE